MANNGEENPQPPDGNARHEVPQPAGGNGEMANSGEPPQPPDGDASQEMLPGSAAINSRNGGEMVHQPEVHLPYRVLADGSDNSEMAIVGQSWAQPDLLQHHLAKISAALDRNTKMVEFIVSRMMHGEPPAVTTSDQGSNEMTGKSKFRAPARKTTHKAANELSYRSCVRNHVKTMMGMARGSHVPPEPAPQEDILKHKSTLNNEDGPSKDKFRADFSETHPENSLWNRRLAEVFVDDYLQKGLPFGEVKDLPSYFMTYLQTLQLTRRRRTSTTASMEEQASQRNRVEKRKHTRFESQLNALYYHDIREFIEPLSQMSRAVLSDDESDHENGRHVGQSRYAIVKEAWRSDELIVWLRMMDLLACGEKWDNRNVARRGNRRRLRAHSTRSKDGVAVSGLPENCYNPGWLTTLQAYERKMLKVKPPMNMQFSDEERRRAARYVPLAQGQADPLTNPDISDLDDWLLNRFGKVEEQVASTLMGGM
ncbi:hypothetical protein BC826DRAFT_1107756 [Russula brevipes]|nr:hypothetical protein BC826DRAFT_1107756 [Russula brevipes]